MLLNKIIFIGIGILIGTTFSGIVLHHSAQEGKLAPDMKIAKLDNGDIDKACRKKVEAYQKISTPNEKAETRKTMIMDNFNNTVSYKDILYKGAEGEIYEQAVSDNNLNNSLTEKTENKQIAEENKIEETNELDGTNTEESSENETKKQYALILYSKPKTYTYAFAIKNNSPAGILNSQSQNTFKTISNDDFNNSPQVPIYGDNPFEITADNPPPESVPDVPQLPNINSETDNGEDNNYLLSYTYPLPELPSDT